MTTFDIIYVICYALVLVCYFWAETTGKMKYRAPNKILLASMFFVYGAIQFSTKEAYQPASIHMLLMAGLFLAWLGDVFLLVDFGRGGDFFLACNVCFFMYELAMLIDNGLTFGDFWWIFVALIIVIAILVVLANKFPNVFKFGKMKYPFIFYLTSITLHGITGIAVMIFVPQLFLLGLGSLLFMVSDYFLTVNSFIYPNKWILRGNSATYFVGMMLIVLSMAL